MHCALVNLLTLARLPLAAGVIYLLLAAWPPPVETSAALLLLGVYAAGAATDWLDGFLARRWQVITGWGKIADALIDKIFVLSVFGGILAVGLMPGWMLALLVLMAVREFGITFWRLWLVRKGVVIAADKGGKRKTVTQMVSQLVFLLVPLAAALGLGGTSLDALRWLAWGLFLLAVWFTLHSGWNYLATYYRSPPTTSA